MNERSILQQRIMTLTGLLDTPGGPLGPNAGALGDEIREGWEVERRLLERLLAETPADDVLSTVVNWRERTTAFVAKSGATPAVWKDRDGRSWDAEVVLGLLSEVQDLIERWLRTAAGDSADLGLSGGEPGPARE